MNTLLESLQESLRRAARFNPDDAVQPAAVLWADPDEQWQPVVEQLRRLMPELLTLGEYAPEARTGPVIWLRCVVDRSLPELRFPDSTVPVVYLPGTSRQVLRAGQECPDELKPLIELQYRGTSWMQRNGRDWTVEAFLMSEDGGLGLDVARDAATRRAIQTALSALASTPVRRLHGRLEAEDFEKLLSEDTVKDLLVWLSDPAATRGTWSDGKWSAFHSRCRAEFDFDPENDGELAGAERLARREGNWAGAWDRFAESPALYPGIPVLLRRAGPPDMFADPSPWPQRNEEMESQLRTGLRKLVGMDMNRARDAIRSLEAEHGPRRDWVWARLGEAPLVVCLQHLAVLAERCGATVGGATLEEFASAYLDGAFRADMAVLDALGSVRSGADVKAVTSAVRSLYLPWLERLATDFQALLQKQGVSEVPESIDAGTGGLVLFADGLRFDVANRLAERMRHKGWEVLLGKRWAGIPTVTATAKPLVSPVASKLSGKALGEDFLPLVTESGQTLSTDRFRKLLGANGYQYVGKADTGDPAGRGWTEYGDLDHLGHDLGRRLANVIDEQIDLLLERVQALFDAGWQRIRIVTDHGWLLMPGGLEKVDLPKYLTESRWSRCAVIKGASKVDAPVFPWFWNPAEQVAVAPGVHCFVKGSEYAHGGVSLQECLIPDLQVTPGQAAAVPVSIEEVKWLGMRCQVRISPMQPGLRVELRTRINDATSGIAEPKAPGDDGVSRLLVTGDDLQGTSAVVVVADAAGHVISKKSTIVGGGEEA